MKAPAVIVSDKFITVNFGNKTFMVNQCDPKFDRAIELYKAQSWIELHEFLNEEKKLEPVKEFTQGNVTVSGGEVLYKGKPVTGYIVDKILKFKELGFPYQPVVNFLNNLLESHSWDVVRELYQFLERAGDMPITEDGAFLAYRKVDSNYMSYHPNPDGTHNRNQVGDVVEMLPCDVDPDRQNECSKGLHFCSQGYLPNYYGGSGRVMRVKIFPQHCIAFPKDYDHSKGRCYKYEVVGECPDLHTLAFGSELYTATGQEYPTVETEETCQGKCGCCNCNNECEQCLEDNVIDCILPNMVDQTVGVTVDSHLVELQLDELDLIEITMALEDKFDIECEDGDESDWVTVQDIVDYVREKQSNNIVGESEQTSAPKVKPTLNIDIIAKINNYLERHKGETITLRKINKSLKMIGFKVQDVEKYLIHMGHTVERVAPYNQSYIV